jgi:integrase/recombinase XerD
MEIANLRSGDIDSERGLVLVNRGKWQKDRWVPISSRALMWIRRYLDKARPLLARTSDSGTLFLTRNGLPFNQSWLSTTISNHVSKAELGKRGSCHLFRHSMATLMLENGADIRFIQEMLGHADLKSTQIYTHVAMHELKAVHEATHPGAGSSYQRRGGKPKLPPPEVPLKQILRAMVEQLPDTATLDDVVRYLALPHLSRPNVRKPS